MPPDGEEKRLQKNEKTNTIKQINIGDLHDDCLRIIFSLLSNIDCLAAERVCQKWREIVSGVWRTRKVLDINDKIYLSTVNQSSKEVTVNVNDFLRILQRCAEHIVELNLFLIPQKSQQFLFEPPFERDLPTLDQTSKLKFVSLLETAKGFLLNCHNIERLSLDYNIIPLTGTSLSALLNNNEKLRCLSLNGFYIKEEVQISRIYCQLESLTVSNCRSQARYLNLQALQGAEKLESLCLQIKFQTYRDNFPTQFLPANLLQIYLCFEGRSGFDSIYSGLPEIENLRNLRVLSISFDIDDNDLFALTESCTNLVAVDLSWNCKRITNVGLERINTELPKLVCLKYGSFSQFIDGGIRCLSVNLKVLVIEGGRFTARDMIDFLQRAGSLEVLKVNFREENAPEISIALIDVIKSRFDRGSSVPLRTNIGRHLPEGTLRETANEMNNSYPSLEIRFDDKLQVDYSGYIDSSCDLQI